jgi:DNA modification methylase
LTVGDAIYKSVCPRCGAVREDEQLGLEETPEAYIEQMVAVFREVKRVLADDGTLWLNIGDSYAGSGKGANADGSVTATGKQATSKGTTMGTFAKGFTGDGIKPKDMIGIPWMLAFALRADGWYLRQDIIWAKPNPMPESVTDRCTKSHEYVFLLSKSKQYFFDHVAIKEEATTAPTTGRVIPYSAHIQTGGIATQNLGTSMPDGKRNKRDVWNIATKPFKEAHFAVMPEALVEPCVLAGSAVGDTVLDPFTGSGTVAVVALRHGRNFIGTELNPEYAKIAHNRISDSAPMFNVVNFR